MAPDKFRARVIAVVGDQFVVVEKTHPGYPHPRTTFPGWFIRQYSTERDEAAQHFFQQTGIPVASTEFHREVVDIKYEDHAYRVFVLALTPERLTAALSRVSTKTWAQLQRMRKAGKDTSTTLDVLDILESYVFPKREVKNKKALAA